jgi:hypothetical protein
MWAWVDSFLFFLFPFFYLLYYIISDNDDGWKELWWKGLEIHRMSPTPLPTPGSPVQWKLQDNNEKDEVGIAVIGNQGQGGIRGGWDRASKHCNN